MKYFGVRYCKKTFPMPFRTWAWWIVKNGKPIVKGVRDVFFMRFLGVELEVIDF